MRQYRTSVAVLPAADPVTPVRRQAAEGRTLLRAQRADLGGRRGMFSLTVAGPDGSHADAQSGWRQPPTGWAPRRPQEPLRKPWSPGGWTQGTGQARLITRWKPALNAFAITFADRMPAAENLWKMRAGNTVRGTAP